MVISIIVITNIIQMTSEYLHYPSEIKILINNNNEDFNYPRITLNTAISYNIFQDFVIYRKWNEYLSDKGLNLSKEEENDYFSYGSKSCQQKDLIIRKELNRNVGVKYIDLFTFYIVECYNLTAKDLLDERLLKKINDRY